MNVER